ncbi:MAG: glycoside hydrolase family 36 protein, partial [Blastocatellia bacterium]
MPKAHLKSLLLCQLALLFCLAPAAAQSGESAKEAQFHQLREKQRQLLAKAPAPGKVAIESGRETIALANEQAILIVDRRTGRWDMAAGPGSAIFGAGFAVEVNGKQLITGVVESTVRAFSDAMGTGQELRQVWRAGALQAQRELRLYDGLAVLTLGGRITNQTAATVTLGTAQLLQLGGDGWWRTGATGEPPAAVYAPKPAQMAVLPFATTGKIPAQQEYNSSGVLALSGRQTAAAGLTTLLIGYVRADDASPDLSATYKTAAGGTALTASSRYLGRQLPPRARVDLNRMYIAGGGEPYPLLEQYGDAMARFSPLPPRTGPVSLWCSWYAHRMDVSEDKVLANAAVAARHFAPLGFQIMQIDHGWQRGDITGDWTANERFPHGLKWLAGELREKYGLKLGLWISPTDVADTSEFYKQHPDWMLQGEDGASKVNWRWYWKPNPNCYQLDTTRPEAFDHVAGVFRDLVAQDVSYFKIDFIGSQAKEQFYPQDKKYARGWPVFRRAMEAVRAGAGDAWVRYCQAPPLLSVGLANGAYGGDDTADAGVPGMFRVLRDNAGILAASYWLNDRVYHREVCDMSMRMHATVEEARVRAAMMTLANASISWSDELTYLPASRIRMMQQCMPAGNPPMRPVDLLEREIPSVWHIRAKNNAGSWDVVGLFNFGEEKTAARGLRFEQLGLDPQAEYAVFEFWEEKFLGVLKQGVELTLPPKSSRILSIRRVNGAPQLIGTDMHLLQGFHELKELAWDAG